MHSFCTGALTRTWESVSTRLKYSQGVRLSCSQAGGGLGARPHSVWKTLMMALMSVRSDRYGHCSSACASTTCAGRICKAQGAAAG